MKRHRNETFVNNSGLAGFIFMIVWIAMLALFTFIFIRDGGFHQFSMPIELGILGGFWIVGLFGAAHFGSLQGTRIEFVGDRAHITSFSPRQFLRHTALPKKEISLEHVSAAKLNSREDGDGDLVFECTATLSGESLIFFQSSSRALAAENIDRWNKRLFKQGDTQNLVASSRNNS
jgi:hypothetical protein